jgi:HK97 family phage portal protein
MSLLARAIQGEAPPQRRGFGSGGSSFSGGAFTGTSDAGVTVTPERSLSVGAAFAAMNLIARTIGMLPRRIVERGDASRRQVRTPEFSHLWGSPNPATLGLSFWETLNLGIEGWGNGYTWKGRDPNVMFDPVNSWRGVNELWHVNPRRVWVGTNGRGEKGFQLDNRREEPFTTKEIGHIPSLSVDGIRGLSPALVGAQAMGAYIAVESFGSKFFANGSTLSGIISVDNKVPRADAKAMIDLWNEEHQGLDNAHLMAVMGGNAKYQSVGIDPQAAQALQTRAFLREEVISFFGPIPHHLLGWKSNTSNFGTGIEAQGIHLIQYVLLNRLTRIEQWVEAELLPPDLQFRFTLNQLARADMKTRASFYKTMREMGIFTADQILTTEDLPPRGIEDDYLEPGNMRRISASSGGDLSAQGVPGSKRGREMGRPAAMAAEARCPDCNSMLGRDVVSAGLWCRGCKMQHSWFNGALVGSAPAAPRLDTIDESERIADMIADRVF